MKFRIGFLSSVIEWLIIIVLLPYALALPYRFIAPPSTLMLYDWARLKTVQRDWVDLSEISPGAIMAVAISEDDAFCSHRGIDFDQLERSIRKAQLRDAQVKATSTITQQLAKNLFLWQGRSWVRKALEAPLALWLEMVWPKDYIMEAYLNVAQWGDGIYGIEAASQHYFGKPASKLSYTEGALLATALPNPLERPANRASAHHAQLANALLERLKHHRSDLSCLR